MNGYDNIRCVEAEIWGYRKACIRARIDLERRLVTWRDNQQWNNNFLRSFSAGCAQRFSDGLEAADVLSWATHYQEDVDADAISSTHRDTKWTLVIVFWDHTTRKVDGEAFFPKEWPIFRDLVESVTKVPFRLR